MAPTNWSWPPPFSRKSTSSDASYVLIADGPDGVDTTHDQEPDDELHPRNGNNEVGVDCPQLPTRAREASRAEAPEPTEGEAVQSQMILEREVG